MKNSAPRVRTRSRAVEDYLKAIYKLQQSGSPVSTTGLAEELKRSPASVTNMVKALAEQGLLEHEPYHGARLTPSGELYALLVLRRHRVLELYLIEKLGYTWDDVHEEAERLEHAAGDGLIDRMARALGEPRFDPHGSPIPTREGKVASTAELLRLCDLPPRVTAVVREVSDESSDGLRSLGSLGLFPGTRVRIADGGDRASGEESERELVLEIGRETHRLSHELARTVSVEVLSAGVPRTHSTSERESMTSHEP